MRKHSEETKIVFDVEKYDSRHIKTIIKVVEEAAYEKYVLSVMQLNTLQSVIPKSMKDKATLNMIPGKDKN